eukprot:gene1354-789_t
MCYRKNAQKNAVLLSRQEEEQIVVAVGGEKEKEGMKDKGFSYRNKVQQYHGDGRESIIVMGRPFKVLENLSAPTKESRRRLKRDSTRNTMVFLVENTSRLTAFPRHFALKRAMFNIDQIQEAHREIEILSRLNDKNIVKSYHCEVSRHEGKLGVSICTEYCTNTLWKRIKSGGSGGTGTRLSESEIANLLIGVTSALGYLHAQQPPIAYRNIHPENILISNRNTGPAMYKLCNFSLATTEAFQCIQREEASRVIEDTERYSSLAFIAPEMADPFSRKRIDEQVDMWALGVLLYSVMYMKLPFEPTITTLSKNPRYHVPVNSTYSGSYQTILKHLLDPDPASRWNVFALTNFLRFDEDIGRHLSTFCFTYTEYPEGWEEQTVYVVNRPVPEKNPPVTYGEGAPVARVGGATTVGDLDNDVPDDFTPPPPPAQSSVPTDDPGFQRAVALLESTGDIDDPRIAPYKEAIIQQQTTMWSSATGQPAPAAGPSAAQDASPSPPKDELEDLFGGPPTAEPQPNNSNNNAAHYDPLADAFGGVQVSPDPAPKMMDRFSADDLFAPAPTAGPPPGFQPPPPVWADRNNVNSMPPQGPIDFFSAPGGAAPPMAPGGFGAYPPQQQQQPQPPGGRFSSGAPVDFLAPPVGMPPAAPQPAALTPGIAKKADVPGAKERDPFADLFAS